MKTFKISSALTIISFLLIASLSLRNPPPNYIIFDYTGGDAAGVSFQGFNLKVILFLAVNYILLAFWGWSLTLPFWSSIEQISWLIKLVGSFFIGYVCSLGIIRLVSIFSPYFYVYWPTIMIILMCMAYCVKSQRRYLTNFRLGASTTSWKIILGQFFLLGGLFFLLLIHQIRMGHFAWVGHGNNQYAYLLDQWRTENLSHFPIITKHYDELIFHYFLTNPLSGHFAPILPWWITLALIKISITAFIYSVFRKLSVSPPASFIFTLYMIAGTTALMPTRYYILFDSANPISYIVHTGRIVGIGFLFLYLMDIIFSHKSGQRLSALFLFLSGLGLTATSFSNTFWVGAIFFLSIFYVSYYLKIDSEKIKKYELINGYLLSCVSLFSLLLMYGLSFTEDYAYIIRLVLLGCLFILVLPRTLWKISVPTFLYRNQEFFNHKQAERLLIMLTSLGIGLIFLGNMFVSNNGAMFIFSHLKHLTGEIPFLNLCDWKGQGASILSNSSAVGDFREIALWNQYCHGLIPFASYYGGIMIIILLTNYYFINSNRYLQPFTYIDYVLYEIFIIAVVSLPFFFFFMDFVDYAGRAWVKSRFLELPLYLIVLIFFYFVHRLKKNWIKGLIFLLLFVYIIGPMAGSKRCQQWRYNWSLFLSLKHPLNG